MLCLVGVCGSVLTHCRCRTSRELWLVPQEITDILRWLDKCRSLRNASKCSRRPLVPRIMEYDPGDSTVSTTGELILAGDFNRAFLKINDKQSVRDFVHVVINFTMFFLGYRTLRYYPTCLFCPCSFTFHHVFPGIPFPTHITRHACLKCIYPKCENSPCATWYSSTHVCYIGLL